MWLESYSVFTGGWIVIKAGYKETMESILFLLSTMGAWTLQAVIIYWVGLPINNWTMVPALFTGSAIAGYVMTRVCSRNRH